MALPQTHNLAMVWIVNRPIIVFIVMFISSMVTIVIICYHHHHHHKHIMHLCDDAWTNSPGENRNPRPAAHLRVKHYNCYNCEHLSNPHLL